MSSKIMLLCLIVGLQLIGSDNELCKALSSQDYERAQELINAKADVHATCIEGVFRCTMAPLHFAARDRHASLIQSLIAAKACTDAVATYSTRAKFHAYHFYIASDVDVKGDVSPLMQLLGNDPSQDKIAQALHYCLTNHARQGADFSLTCDADIVSCAQLLLGNMTEEGIERHGFSMINHLGGKLNSDGCSAPLYELLLPQLSVAVKQAFLQRFKGAVRSKEVDDARVRKWVQESIDADGKVVREEVPGVGGHAQEPVEGGGRAAEGE